MNKSLVEKLLGRLTLNDLYAEIKNNGQAIFTLGIILAKKKPDVFISIIGAFIEKHVNSQADSDMRKFLKEEIINMDGTETISINETVKRKPATPKPAVDNDPCSRGGGGRISSC